MKISNYSFVTVLALFFICEIGLCMASSAEEDEGFITMKTSTLLGGLREYRGNENDGEIESIGRFAVQEHNKKENSLLEFGKVIKAKQRVVAGMMYHLTLEAIDAGKKKMYEAKVWVKPWMNFKQLQEFRHAADVGSSSSSEPVVEEDNHRPGWRTLSRHDPSVLDAAHYAVENIQDRSNCLGACFLLEILLAKAKEIENDMKFYLLLKTKWNTREEIYKVMLSKNMNGKFYRFEFL